MNGEPLLQAHELVKRFGTVTAVDGVTLDVIEGEALGIVGESGAGKTTLARLLALGTAPSSGGLRLGGADVAGVKRGELRRLRAEVQMTFPDPDSSLNPRRTVGAILAEPFAVHGRPKSERRQLVVDLLARVGLDPAQYASRPAELTRDERQCVAVARAIALQPRLLILDEPVAALGIAGRARVLNLLVELKRALGLTVVLTTSDLAVARYVCDRIAVMYRGAVVELARTDWLYGLPRHPYTGALLGSMQVPRPDFARRERQQLRGEEPRPQERPTGCRFHPRCPKAQERCAQEDPPLGDAGQGSLVACHFPLTREEVARLPAGPA
ncbi:MAG TPA: oligopeptide/dipeptide ABC transporter ATP-binding protein [Solirubrobacteraceae bacterium]|nr:oligopeptide/dipeptide ABC transporter ATP-binding protein [Solirubrobacteraceae bacterium]